MRSRLILLWGTLALVLVTVNALILREEHIRRTGRTVYLELLPRDPRSLLQGDYMVLRYAAARDVEAQYLSYSGTVVLALDARGVGTFMRRYEKGDPLADNELILRCWPSADGISFGVESFFFQEGHADYYAPARYAELRVDRRGNAALVGLRGANLEVLDPGG